MSGAAVGAVQIFYYGFVGFAPRLSQLGIQHVYMREAHVDHRYDVNAETGDPVYVVMTAMRVEDS